MFRFGILVAGIAGLAGCVGEEANLAATAVEPAPAAVAAAEPVVAAPVPTNPRARGKVAAVPLPPQRPFAAAPAVAAGTPARTVAVAATTPDPSPAPVEPAPEAYAAKAETVDSPFAALFTPANFTPQAPARAESAAEPRVDDAELVLQPPADPGRATPRSTAPGQRYYAAYPNTVISCFPAPLREALNTIAEHYGKDVEVTSGFRANGRRGSYHRKCMAADIRVEGVAPSDLSTFVRGIDGVNGVGTYRHTSVTHIDVRDYQMSWRY